MSLNTAQLIVGAGLTTAGTWLALTLLDREGRAVRERADHLVHPTVPTERPVRTGGPLRRIAGFIEPAVRDLEAGKGLERLLWMAALAYTPSEFLVAGALVAAAGAAAAWLFLGPLGLAGVLAGLVPLLIARRRAEANRKALVAQLPDALLLLVNALRSGHGLMQAMKVVASQAPAPVSTEMGAVLDEINWGLSVEAALRNMGARACLVEVDLAVGAILVQRETGGNLAEILTNLQDMLRDRARVAGEVHALTAQGRLSGWVLSLLPVGIGAAFSVVNPGYLLPFLLDPRGRTIAMGAALAQILGILAIRKIVSVKY